MATPRRASMESKRWRGMGWRLTHPLARIATDPHPGAQRALVAASPAHLDIAEHPLRVRHHGRESAVGRGHGGQTARAAVRIEGVAFGDLAMVVGETHCGNRLVLVTSHRKVGEAF